MVSHSAQYLRLDITVLPSFPSFFLLLFLLLLLPLAPRPSPSLRCRDRFQYAKSPHRLSQPPPFQQQQQQPRQGEQRFRGRADIGQRRQQRGSRQQQQTAESSQETGRAEFKLTIYTTFSKKELTAQSVLRTMLSYPIAPPSISSVAESGERGNPPTPMGKRRGVQRVNPWGLISLEVRSLRGRWLPLRHLELIESASTTYGVALPIGGLGERHYRTKVANSENCKETCGKLNCRYMRTVILTYLNTHYH